MPILLALALLAAPHAKDPGRALAQRVQRFYASTRDFSARFAQHYSYLALGRVEDSEGTVQVKKPGLVRWDYQKPDRRVIYLENRTLWIWRPDDQEAQVRENFGGDQLSSAFTFLWGKGDLLAEFSAKAVPRPEDVPGLPKGEAVELLPREPQPSVHKLLFVVELTPLKPVAGVSKLIFVVARDGQVLATLVTNPQGDVNQMVFTAAKVNQGLADALFHFEPPKGAYVQKL